MRRVSVALSIAAMFLVASGSVAMASDFGVLEGRGYTPLNDLGDLELGAGVALQLGIVPDDLFLVGPFIGGHKVFLDAAAIEGQWALGGSLSLKKAPSDNGWRLFAAGWKERGFRRKFRGAYGLAYGWELDVAEWLR